eukprot:CAMPEP_0183776718 /NCGR_PEP_ID=MMETSP0739-20130205/47448_1 /TAXON_ID=385413 /ORGANISM="Thalassiosira miniscula, Strain CCMP1093" /LENGTH=416 /DNA_ID=CAMNT_0026018655 /DNA_START=18 /DNA_END=1268 /DNA_ORIENTATION=-
MGEDDEYESYKAGHNPTQTNSEGGEGGDCGDESIHAPAIIIDNGSFNTRAGLANGDGGRPSTVFRTMVASGMRSDIGPTLVGDEAEEVRADGRYHIRCGPLMSMDDMEHIWRHAFYSLRKDTANDYQERHPVLLTEPPWSPKIRRERMASLMFEKFPCCALYIACAPVLALFATGRTTGCVVDSGRETTVVSIYEGFYCSSSSISSPCPGGEDLTDYFISILSGSNPDANIKHSRNIAELRRLKESMCYVALDYEKEDEAQIEETTYKLEDGDGINIGKERFQCPEILFLPLESWKMESIPKAIHKSIMEAHREIEIASVLYANIVLTGGNALLRGFADRLVKELKLLAGPFIAVRVVTAPNEAAWAGGSLLSGLTTFQDIWVTEKEYQDVGVEILHRIGAFGECQDFRSMFGGTL